MDETHQNQNQHKQLRFAIAGVVAGFAMLCLYNLLRDPTVRFRTEFIHNDNATFLLRLGKDLLLFVGGGLTIGILLERWLRKGRRRAAK